MGIEGYTGSIRMTAGMIPESDGYPLVQACDILAEKDKRLDVLLTEIKNLALSGGGSISGAPIPIETEAEMNDILASATEDKVGTIYKYTGTSTDTYEQGALYIIAEAIPDGDEVGH